MVERSSDNPGREMAEPTPSRRVLQRLAARARYEGHPKHKLEPRAFGLEPMRSVSEDATYCDGHAGFTPADMSRVPRLLARGVRAGLVGARLRDGDPALLWTVDDDGWIYEARLTVAGQAIYHAFPILTRDAVARRVIARYLAYVYESGDAELAASAANVQDRYAQ